jgi:hypothetical protein
VRSGPGGCNPWAASSILPLKTGSYSGPVSPFRLGIPRHKRRRKPSAARRKVVSTRSNGFVPFQPIHKRAL